MYNVMTIHMSHSTSGRDCEPSNDAGDRKVQTGLWQTASGYMRGRLAAFLTASRERRAGRREMQRLLARPDDHLIDDAGLSRTDLRTLTDDWKD